MNFCARAALFFAALSFSTPHSRIVAVASYSLIGMPQFNGMISGDNLDNYDVELNFVTHKLDLFRIIVKAG